MEKQKKGNILLTLFLSTLSISTFTFGGGFVIVSLMKKKFVEELKWLDEEEMMNIAAIAQSSPGPIPINASIIIGYKMAGIVGALVSIAGTALPPLIIISIISMFFDQFKQSQIISIALKVMRAGVAAVIVDVALTFFKNIWETKRKLYQIVSVSAFILVVFFNLSAILTILICLGIGLVDLAISRRKAK